MNTVHIIYQLSRADFFERIRRFSFAVTLVVTVIATYIFVPANNATYSTLDLGGHRGLYNSAWIGAQVALLTSSFLVIFGFYLVRNAINRDRSTGVGQIIAGTPVSKPVYTLGKWLSNCAVLGLIGAVVAVGAAILQLMRGEDMVLRPIPLIAPFIYLLIPTIALISAIAVLFECIPFLSHGFGNIAYFFVVPQLIMPEMLGGPKVLGISYLIKEMQTACRAVYPDYVDALSLGINFHGGRSPELTTFVWSGMSLTAEFLQNRLLWFLVAVGIAMVAALPFDRFDRTRKGRRSPDVDHKPRFSRIRGLFGRRDFSSIDDAGLLAPAGNASEHVHLTPLAGSRSRGRFGGILLANLRLALRAMPWWWHLGALGLIVCEIFIPQAGVRAFVLAGAWIWPMMIWSSLGNRELTHATHQVVFSAAHPLRRQLSSAWLAGVIIALGISSGACARWMVTGDWPRVLAMIVGAIYVPSLALALGAWSRTSRLFEVLYLFLWYLGPVNAIAALDFAGSSEPAGSPGVTLAYAVAAAILLVLGFLGGRRQLTS